MMYEKNGPEPEDDLRYLVPYKFNKIFVNIKIILNLQICLFLSEKLL